MMEDLSHLLPGGRISALAPTSQSAGNMTSGRAAAMSAPGSQPADPLPDRSEQGDPSIEAVRYDPPNIVTGSGGNPVPVPDGRWHDIGDVRTDSAQTRAAPVIRMGEWNDV